MYTIKTDTIKNRRQVQRLLSLYLSSVNYVNFTESKKLCRTDMAGDNVSDISMEMMIYTRKPVFPVRNLPATCNFTLYSLWRGRSDTRLI